MAKTVRRGRPPKDPTRGPREGRSMKVYVREYDEARYISQHLARDSGLADVIDAAILAYVRAGRETFNGGKPIDPQTPLTMKKRGR